MTVAPTGNVNVASLLAAAAVRRGSAPALFSADGRLLWRFDELAEAAARLAGGLLEHGLLPGSRVVVLERDPRELFRVVAGIIWAGGCVVLPPLSLPVPAALRVAADAQPFAVIASVRAWGAALPFAPLRRAPLRIVSGQRTVPSTLSVRVLGRAYAVGPGDVSRDVPAVLSFTTGSTGRVKAVVRTHGVLRAQHEALRTLRAFDEHHRDLAGLPMLVLHNLAAGATSVIAPRGAGEPRYGAAVRQVIGATGVTSASGFPFLLESALERAPAGSLGTLRAAYVGGSRIRPALLRALATAAPGARSTVVYGSTEAEPISAIDGSAYLERLQSSRPEAGVCVGEIIEGLRVRVAPGVDGPGAGHASPTPEVVAVGPGRIFVCGDRAASDVDDGWLETGDVGSVDSDGQLWLLGRAANVAGPLLPIAAERAAEALPEVRRAAVARLDDDAPWSALIAVEPLVWGSREERARLCERVIALGPPLGWPPVRVVAVRRLPSLRGPGAKVDDARLRLLGAA